MSVNVEDELVVDSVVSVDVVVVVVDIEVTVVISAMLLVELEEWLLFIGLNNSICAIGLKIKIIFMFKRIYNCAKNDINYHIF